MMRNLFLSLICWLTFSAHAADSMAVAPETAVAGEITIRSSMGTALKAYVAGPENSSLGILILHDRWGVNDTIHQWVDRFAAKGYRALAIDVFDGRISDKMWLATEILNATDPEWVKADVMGGLNYLKRDGRKIVTLGAGFGGWQSFQAALAGPAEVAGTIVIYGELDADVKQMRSLKAPLLTIFARDDKEITADMTDKYRVLLKKTLISHRNYSYPGGHGFMDPAYPAYDSGLVDEVWGQVDDFLATFVEEAG